MNTICSFQAHLRNKHPGLSDELIFACHLCNFRTIRKEQLNLHIASSHEGAIETCEDALAVDGIQALSHSATDQI